LSTISGIGSGDSSLIAVPNEWHAPDWPATRERRKQTCRNCRDGSVG
jgi:hypothetical protein